MSNPQARKGGRRRSKRRPNPDDRVHIIKVKPTTEMALSEVLQSSGSVRDSRLQSIRLVGGNTLENRVLLRGAFTENSIVNLATLQRNPVRLNRVLTMPRRVRNFFLDAVVTDSEDDCYVIMTNAQGVSYVEFTFLREPPPVFILGQAPEVSVTTTTDNRRDSNVFKANGDFDTDGLFSFHAKGVDYLSKRRQFDFELLSPKKLAETVPSGTEVTFKAQ